MHHPKTIPFTANKYAELEKEFHALKAEREDVKQRLITAREMGDLSENGAYKYAKFELGRIGRRLREVRQLLQDGFVQESQAPTGRVGFGSTVELQKADDTATKKTYTLVSEHESNPLEGKIALSSPIGQALQQAKVGETVTISTPKGTTQYILLAIL